MNATLKIDPDAERKFHAALGQIGSMAGKAMRRIMVEQMSLLVRDAVAFTPPFGDAPITEGLKAQKEIGEVAVRRDIFGGKSEPWHSRAGLFRGVSREVMASAKKGARKIKDGSDALVFVSKTGIAHMAPQEMFRPDATLQEMSDWHQKHRRANGRTHNVSGRGVNAGDVRVTAQMVVKNTILERYYKDVAKRVLTAKSGWVYAWEKLQSWLGRFNASGGTRGIPAPLKKLRGAQSGHYVNSTSDEKPILEAGNTIGYAQKHVGHIVKRAWSNRVRNIQKQADRMAKELAKSLRQKGIDANA
jgi:hypothetical protein